jgi:hypothetical protein
MTKKLSPFTASLLLLLFYFKIVTMHEIYFNKFLFVSKRHRSRDFIFGLNFMQSNDGFCI